MTSPVRAAHLAVVLPVVALVVCGATLADARWIDPLPEGGELSDRLEIPSLPRRAPVLPASALEATLDRNPFRSDRSRAPERYRPPGAVAAAAPQVYAAPAVSRPLPTLQGTVAFADGEGLAAVAVPGQPPRLLRVGESFEGFRLTRVSATTATLVGADTTLVLRLPDSPDQDQS